MRRRVRRRRRRPASRRRPAARAGRARRARPSRRVRGGRGVVRRGGRCRCRSTRRSLEAIARADGPRRRASGRRPAVPAADRPRGARGTARRLVAEGSPRPVSRSSAGGPCRPTRRPLGDRGPGRSGRRSSRRSSGGRSMPRGRAARRRRVRARARPRPSPDRDRGPGGRPRRRVRRSPRRRAGRSSTRASSQAPASPTSIPTCGRRASASATRVFHQRYATNTLPTWRLAQPFRAIAHNGEINTVRGNRAQVRGRAADPAGAAAAELAARRSARRRRRAPTRSRSTSSSSSSWPPAGISARPSSRPSRSRSACAGRRTRNVAALRRRTAGFIAPWDGPAAIVFGDGRRVGAIADRNGLRPIAVAVTRDRLVAVASEAGAIPLAPEETVRRGRLGPGELVLVDPVRGLVLEDVEAKAHLLRRLPIHDAPRTAHVDPPAGDDDSSIVLGGPPTAGEPPVPRRASRRERPARHPDDGHRGSRAALEHGRRRPDPGPRPGRPPRLRPSPPVLRPGDEPADRSRARAHRHGPPNRARPAAGAPRRSAGRLADDPPRAAVPRRPPGPPPRRPGPGRPPRRDLAGRATGPAPCPMPSTAWPATRSRRRAAGRS